MFPPVTATTDSLAPDILNKRGRAVPAPSAAPQDLTSNCRRRSSNERRHHDDCESISKNRLGYGSWRRSRRSNSVRDDYYSQHYHVASVMPIQGPASTRKYAKDREMLPPLVRLTLEGLQHSGNTGDRAEDFRYFGVNTLAVQSLFWARYET